jgi:hypothetical protein
MTTFEKSPNSAKIISFFTRKYCKSVAIPGLVKACSIVSAQFKRRPRLSICMVAPSRHFKTQTNEAQELLFSKKYYLNMGSDFTLHALYDQYYKLNKNVFKQRCLIINDGTLLLSSKEARTKQRLINGLAELLSEGLYIYSERKESWRIDGQISIILNITTESFKQNKNKLISSTLLERFLTIHYRIPSDEQKHSLLKKRQNIKMLYDDTKLDTIKDYDADMDLSKHAERIEELSKKWAILSYRSRMGTFDMIEMLLKSHAVLNDRKELCEDDFKFLECVEPYLIDGTAKQQHKILMMYQKGVDVKDICIGLCRDPNTYKAYVYRVIDLAVMRGIIDEMPGTLEQEIDEEEDEK